MTELVRATDLNSAAELQWRLAMPITAVLLALIAVNLVHVGPQRGRYTGLLSVVIVYFSYSNLLALGRTLIKRGEIPSGLGMWSVHALALAFLIALALWQRMRWRRKLKLADPDEAP
jgi:lipopolysaccharide export system permease protein